MEFPYLSKRWVLEIQIFILIVPTPLNEFGNHRRAYRVGFLHPTNMQMLEPSSDTVARVYPPCGEIAIGPDPDSIP